MSLVDDIEFHGRAAATGDMTTEQATEALVQASSGCLKLAGARDLILNWQTARASYESLANRTFHSLAALRNGRRPHPSTLSKEH